MRNVSFGAQAFSFLYWISSFPQHRTHSATSTFTHNSRHNRSALYFIEYAVGVLVGFTVCFFAVPVYAAVFIYFFLFVFYWYLVFEIVIWYIDCCGETLCGIVDDEDVALVECAIHLYNSSYRGLRT